MALIKVYDLEGTPHDKESIDARECIEFLGFSLEPKIPKSVENQEVEEVKKNKKSQSKG